MNESNSSDTLINLLQNRALTEPDKLALRFIDEQNNNSEYFSYGELDRRARIIASKLQQLTKQGERAILLFPSGLDYVAAFYGCLYAGIIAVPAYPPESARPQHQERLLSIISDAKPSLLLTCSFLYEPLSKVSKQLSLGSTQRIFPELVCIDDIEIDNEHNWQQPTVEPNDIAFLQYTSGSTSAPKGVKVTHRNLVVNSELIRQGFNIDSNDVIVSWLPLYHDMGLIGCLIQSIYSGVLCVLMSPRYFLERPVRWLQAISEYKGTITGGPDFAYRLCSERVADSALESLDLSSWKIAFSGSEPIRHDSLALFSDKFSTCGFKQQQIFSCYGLAEATLFVTGSVRNQGITGLDLDSKALSQNKAQLITDNNSLKSTVMSCGFCQPGHAIRIVDAQTLNVLNDNEVGEIWATGPSIADGYWCNPEATQQSFIESDGCTWLRTGDLGFIREQELFVTGRLKDMLIVRGQNLYPQDIERVVEDEVEVLRKGRVAAYIINFNGKDCIGIAAEVSKKLQKLLSPELLMANIREVVADIFQEAPQQVALLNPGSLPKTSSGKLQRSACRNGIIDGSIEAYSIFPTEKTLNTDNSKQKKKATKTELKPNESSTIILDVIKIWSEILQVEQLKPTEHFFLEGGNSILAVQVIAKCRDIFSIDIDLRLLFDTPILGDFVTAIEQSIKNNLQTQHRNLKNSHITKQPRTQGLPLSSGQSRLWFLWQLDPMFSAYNIPAGMHLSGEINNVALKTCFQQLLNRHESLRTRFLEKDSTVLQYIDPPSEFIIEHHDISMFNEQERQVKAEDFREQEAQRSFDLSAGELFRVKLIRLSQSEHLLLISLHHIIADGWSLNLLLTEFCQLYKLSSQGHDVNSVFKPLARQYADYACWQQQWLNQDEAAHQLDYWQKQLAGELPILQLATDFPRTSSNKLSNDLSREPQQYKNADRFSVIIDEKLTKNLRTFAQSQDCTLFMLLLAGFKSLLHRYTGQEDILIGVPSANRNSTEIQDIVGFFINTIVLRSNISSRLTFIQLLQQIKLTTLDAQMHQDIPINEVVEAIFSKKGQQFKRDVHSESPLFQVMFNHQQRGLNAQSLPDLTAEELSWHSRIAKCDLQLHSEENNQGQVLLSFDYNTELFEKRTIERLSHHLSCLLEHVIKEPEACIGDINLLDVNEHQCLTSWSETAGISSSPSNFNHLIDNLNHQVKLVPNEIVLQWQNGSFTYQELDTKANRLAHYLTSQGVQPEVCVGILVERSPQMLVGLLAIIKAGGAYLPLDPSYPNERLSYMLLDSGVQILLTEQTFLKEDFLTEFQAKNKLISVDNLTLEHLPTNSPVVNLHKDNLAYIIYTSGSTGLPKGVGISHAALQERLEWMKYEYQFDKHDVFLQKAPISFDVSVWECFLPLITGGRLVLSAPGDQRDPDRLVRLVREYGVTVLHFVPPMMQLFIEETGVESCNSLRYLFSGGEVLTVTLRNEIFARLPNIALHNRYGPTETTINATHWHCDVEDGDRSPIGKPLGNVTCQVFDNELRPASIGMPGELYIGGVGLARGYINSKKQYPDPVMEKDNNTASDNPKSHNFGRAALTAERFIPDPMHYGARLYRSGDIVRWNNEGSLDYFGRIDKQIKLRGYRIDPQEIEVQLLAQSIIKQAVVVVHEPKDLSVKSNAQLIAYYVPTQSIEEDVADSRKITEILKNALAKILPSYMIPSYFISLQKLPITANGKLDYHLLPEPNATFNPDVEHIPPVTLLEEQIAEVWQEMLGVTRLGLADDFFRCGGHSLLATQIVSRIRLQCNVDLPLKVLFEHSQLGDFVAQVQHAQQAGCINKMPAIDIIDRNRPVPLSSSQQRLWFLWKIEPDSPAYNVGGMARLTGVFYVEHFAAALQELIERHETLRTTFPSVDGVPIQCVSAKSSIVIQQHDFTHFDTQGCQQQLQKLADDEAHQPFDLEKGPLLRACLVKVSEKEHIFSLTLHHIITEGWAMDIFAREIGEIYQAFLENKPSPLIPLKVGYLDYSVWHNKWLASGEAKRQLDYWTNKLGDEHPVLSLPSDRPRPIIQSYKGGLYRFILEDGLANKVHHFNVKHGLTMFMTMTSVLAVLLYRYSGQNDLRIGAPIANRIRPESEGLIGAFLNTQVLRCQLDGQMTVDQFLLQIRNTVIEGQSHQDLPFDQLVDALKPPRSTAYNPLFQVMCNVQRWNFQQSRELAGMKVDYIINDAEATKFDLNLEVTDLNQQLACCLTYSRDLFNEERIASMATHLINLLTAMVNNPEQRIAELALFSNEDKPSENVSEEVKKLCLSQYNNSDVKPDDGQYCLQDLFSRQVKKTPDAPALSFAEKTLTYAELDHKSNQLARRLRYLGVGAEDYVGLALERSLEMVIGLLAILKAGGAYVPLDPGYPVERLKEIIEDSRIGLLLSDQALFETLGELPSKIKVLCLEKDMNELATYSIDALPSINHPLHQAYLIYTSGSTGKPKGVMVAHGEISSHCQSVIKRFNMCSDDCELHFYSINFDAATERLLAPLLCGSHVVLRGQSQWGVEEICQLIRQYNVNTLGLTPSYGSQLAQWLINRQETLPIRICITGGEMLMAEHLQKIRLAFQPEYFFNAYGPTETVVMPLSCLAPPNLAEHALGVPIGHLVGNRLAYILDENLALSPQGSVGELYVGGRCLARGYHDRRGLTAERFIPNPFTIDQPYNQASGRLYRTGDLVRQGTDGLIEYVGRLDYQVKIRGFRIELGEIESKILAHQTVDETVVLAIDLGSNKQLVAYVASVEATMNSVENEALITQLKQLLKKKLPDYMVPAHWVILPVLPTGPNGKLDRKALPLPDVEQNKQDYVLPSTEVEQLLAEIWTEVLATDTIGINDNFFELGGDSILSIQVVSRARQIGLHFSPRDLFQHQNIKVLAEFCEQQDHEQKHKFNAEQDLIKGEAKLTPIQHWFFSLSMPNRHHWNQAILLSPTQYLESELLEHILHKMLQQHDALRLVFNDQDQPKAHHKLTNKDSQSILETVTVENINQAEQVYSNLFNKLQRSLNLANGPLLKALLVTESGSTGLAYKQRLFIVVHHLVIDGVSWRILIDDIQTSYQQLSNGMEISLPHKTSAFRDWTRRLENYATNDYLKENLSWWQAQLGKSSQSLEEKLPTDYPVVNNSDEATESDAVTITVSLSREKTEKLLQKAPATYHTQVNDLLLTALSRTFCQWSGFSSILVQLEGHGREEIFDDIDLTRTVGWFTSVYPLRLTPSSLMNENGETKSKLLNLADDIKTIKEQLRSVPDKGLSYGILSYLADDACRVAMAELPQAQVTFNYLGQFDQSLGRDALFKSADETTGLSRDENAPLPNLQSIDSQIANGKLVIRWTYSTKCYGKNTIENLANDYLQQLEDIVEHCVSDELATSQISRLTPSDFPLAKLTQKQLDTLPIPAEKIEDIYPLTSMQEGLLLHTLLEPGTGLYYMQDRYRINSEIVPKRFVKAWQLVVSRHEALRASFNWNAGETMLQIIHKPYLIDVEYIDWRQENPIEHEQRLQAMLKEEREAGFDLLNSPPFHLRLICLGEKEYWFIMSNHHILIDAWCRSILMNDFFNIYTALSEEKESQLNAPSSYRDYIVWLQDQDVNVSRLWWKENLRGFEQATGIASDRPLRREHAGDSGGMIVGDSYTNLTKCETEHLQELAQRYQLTINTFAQAAWSLVLRRLSGDREVLFGVTVAGRPIEEPEMQETVGLFINSIPLRVPTPSLDKNITVKEWLQQLLSHNLELREHEYLSLVDIQNCSELSKGSPLFDSLFVFENAPVDSSVYEHARNFNASSDTGRTHTNFPLTAVCYPQETLGLHISYDQRYFDKPSIDSMLGEFKRLLVTLIDYIDLPYSTLPLLSNVEHEFLVKGCNQSTVINQSINAKYQSYVELFEAQVEAHPNRIVASFLNEQWTYQDLNQYANRLSHTLLLQTNIVDQPIALLTERGLNLLAMMIACFKSGNAYLPLDPSHPEQRLLEMINSSQVNILICDKVCHTKARALLSKLSTDARPLLLLWEDVQKTNQYLPADDKGMILNPSIMDYGILNHANRLAYVIYTSGSTGTPKGVMVEHQGMLNNQLSKIPYMKLGMNDVIAQTASQCFDISVWQFLIAPLFGGRVDIIPNEIAHHPQALLKHIQERGITVLESVPSLIQRLFDEGSQNKNLSQISNLRWLLPTGEAMPPGLAEKWLNRYPDIGLINAYGPAECSDDVAFFDIDLASTTSPYLPIGSPTDNNRLYLLDDALDLVPSAAVAELYIAGVGVGRGYSFDAKRTAQAFIPDPFSQSGERLYRSGDLARRRSDGLLEYVGRADQQVKVRGHRIELGEIESQLNKIAQVNEAVVLAKKGLHGFYLVGYVTADQMFTKDAIDDDSSKIKLIEQLKAKLAQKLPEYMVPVHWQILANMPLNPNGKIDRNALPDIDFGQNNSIAYVEPSSELEKTIADIWADILKVDKVGVNDNFFELGGHSLLASQIASRLQQLLQCNIPLRVMFESSTVRELSKKIDSLKNVSIDEEKAEWLHDFMTELEDL